MGQAEARGQVLVRDRMEYRALQVVLRARLHAGPSEDVVEFDASVVQHAFVHLAAVGSDELVALAACCASGAFRYVWVERDQVTLPSLPYPKRPRIVAPAPDR
jgi:hypothetical protein